MSRAKLGHVRQLDNGKWIAQVRTGYDRNGKRRSRSKVCDTEREAQAMVGMLAFEMGCETDSSDMTVAEYWCAYFMPMREASELARGTISGDLSAYRKYIEPVFGDTPLDALTRRQVKRWLLTIAEPGARHNAMRTLRKILNAALDDDFIETHPLLHPIKIAAQKTPKRRAVWNAEQLFACIDYMYLSGHELLPLVLVMAGGGLGKEEALALTADKLAYVRTGDVCRCYVSVEAAYTDLDGYKEPKNEHRRRTVVIGEPFASLLESVAPEYGALVPRGLSTISSRHAQRLWKRMFEEFGGEYIWLNELRHTHTTLMQSARVQDSIISKAHGHSQLSTTYEHYMRPDIEAMENAADALAEYVCHRLP